MGFQFETLGNATLQLFQDHKPLLVTDPWLKGTAYFGSWALDHDLSDEQIANAIGSPYIWFSHGHPDHLHSESIAMLSRASRILLPDHYSPEIKEYLESEGFTVQVLRFKEWTPIAPNVRVLCMENENADAVLLIEAGDALIINMNDSGLYGEEGFMRKLVSRYEKSFLLALCSIDADMFNLVDDEGRPVRVPPDERKPGTILALSDLCTQLGVRYFCCSSSQHVYVRADSAWANPYRITWQDMKAHWGTTATRLIEPFVTIDLDTCAVTRNYPSQETDMSRVSSQTGNDDWSEPMVESDWKELEKFIRRFPLLSRHMDFMRFSVGGESRTFYLQGRTKRRDGGEERGITFFVPRNSLMETVRNGYFDDLLIGNFMRTQLHNMTLYPSFSPTIAKIGGNAKVYTFRELLAYRMHHFRRSPAAWMKWRMEQLWMYYGKPEARRLLDDLGVLEPIKHAARRLQRLPPVPQQQPR